LGITGMIHTDIIARVKTKLWEEEGELWYRHTDGKRRKYKSRPKTNNGRMFVNGKYISRTHPLYKAGRYKSFNDAAFSSFTNYKRVNKGEVYIIVNEAWPEWVKVGKAVSSLDRLASYQTSAPLRDYKLFCAVPVDNRHEFEVDCHAALKSAGLDFKNEWFKTTPQKAKEIMEKAYEER